MLAGVRDPVSCRADHARRGPGEQRADLSRGRATAIPPSDTFTHVVDLDDVAPFAKSAKYAHGWAQMTNGLTSGRPLEVHLLSRTVKNDPKPKWSASCPRKRRFLELLVIMNAHYRRITKLRLIFDNNEADAVTLDLKPVAELRQDFTLKRRKFKRSPWSRSPG